MNDVLLHVSEGRGKIDKACRARREEVRRQIAGHRRGAPLPEVTYSEEENVLWQTVISQLKAIHPDVACSQYLKATDRLALPITSVPRLQDISDQLRSHTGFQLIPAGDLVRPEDFYSTFTDGYFQSTMYMRCPAVPLYSPDPDVLHELVGHAVMLTDPLFADLYRSFGKAVALCQSEDKVQEISKVFWYTMETGLVREPGGLRAYGAALLSSVGELESITKVDLKEFSIKKMLNQPYDIYQYQPMLFVVDSIDVLANEIRNFLDNQLRDQS
jgi:phenylalanine-4-hydroxylase